jgi:hypothetical protein
MTLSLSRHRAWSCSRTPIVAVFLVLACGGCVVQSTDGNVTTCHYAWWLPAGVLAGCIVAIPLGLVISRWSSRIGLGLVVAGPLAAIFFVPSLFFEQLKVNDEGFEVRSGIWGLTASQSVRFDGTRQLRIIQKRSSGPRPRDIDVLIFDQAGGEARLSLNNDVKIEAGPIILERATSRGIRIVDNR